jgi:transcriptional regulator with XRE-family HTH domain
MPEKAQSLAMAEFFGENLRRIRKREDLSQEKLAKRASLHRTEIGFLEHAGRICRIDTLVCLAGAMSVSPGELLDGILWIPSPELEGTFTFNSRPYVDLYGDLRTPKDRKSDASQKGEKEGDQ